MSPLTDLYRNAVINQLSLIHELGATYTIITQSVQDVYFSEEQKAQGIQIVMEEWPLEESSLTDEGLSFPFVDAEENITQALIFYEDILILLDNNTKQVLLAKPPYHLETPVDDTSPQLFVEKMIERATSYEALHKEEIEYSMSKLTLRKQQ